MSVRSPVLAGRLTRLAVLSLVALLACKDDPTLKVTGLDPDRGDAEGGTFVRIQGNRFIADGAMNAKVYFGQHQGTVVRFASDSELIVESPGGNVGDTVDVLVMFEGTKIGQREITLHKAFTFVEKKQLNADDIGTKKKN